MSCPFKDNIGRGRKADDNSPLFKICKFLLLYSPNLQASNKMRNRCETADNDDVGWWKREFVGSYIVEQVAVRIPSSEEDRVELGACIASAEDDGSAPIILLLKTEI